MKKAFWDIYKSELEKPELNYSVFIPLIREVITFVEKCVESIQSLLRNILMF